MCQAYHRQAGPFVPQRRIHFQLDGVKGRIWSGGFPASEPASIHIMAAIAEHEAKMISDRTRAALAAAKARGKQLGGFRGRAGTAADCAKARRAKSLAAKSRAADLAPVIEDIRTAGANSLRSIAKELNERGISAPRGGVWSAAQVRAAIARIPAFR
jgi:DNA invertase Pin-like site-specific DNA recombinase